MNWIQQVEGARGSFFEQSLTNLFQKSQTTLTDSSIFLGKDKNDLETLHRGLVYDLDVQKEPILKILLEPRS